MFTHKKLFFFSLIFPVLIFSACAGSYAPDNYLPETENIPQTVYGAWIVVFTAPDTSDSDDKWLMYGGEFIAVDDSIVYVMYDSIYQISKNKVTASSLELDRKNTTEYGVWVMGGSLLTLSNGYYASITLPLWLIAGIPSVFGESERDKYDMDEPDEAYWDSIKVFARFPQGLDGIDLSQIKPYEIIKE